MKLIQAIIKPYRLEEVRESLEEKGITGMTVLEAKGFGAQRGHTELYRGAEYQVEFVTKVMLELALKDDQVDEVIELILKSAQTGKIGDGKIFILELADCIRIRTGEKGEIAL